MTRRVFYSFHYAPDNWRASQVRNIGVISGNRPATDNDWETVKRGGDRAIKRWITEQMHGRSCTIVLVGTNTADRKWINYEIVKSWKDGMGVMGIYIHGLKDDRGKVSRKGNNPFRFVDPDGTGTNLSGIVKCYDPRGKSSHARYNCIAEHIAVWVEEALGIRKQN